MLEEQNDEPVRRQKTRTLRRFVLHFEQIRTLVGLGTVYEAKGMHDEAIRALEKSNSLIGRTPAPLAMMGHAYATSGRKAEAQKILAQLNEMSRQMYVSSFDLAILYVGLGEKEKALEQRRHCARPGPKEASKSDVRFYGLRTHTGFD